MIIAQISDLHLTSSETPLLGRVDAYGMAKAAVEHVRGLVPRPDVVLVTGDIVAFPTPETYRLARELLDGLGLPYLVIPGNHDRRRPMLDAFGGHAAPAGPVGSAGPTGQFVQFAVVDHGVLLVGVDTLDEGEETGLVCDERLRWLEATLAANPFRHTIVFMHHPPFETGIWWMDTAGLAGARAFCSLVERHPQVVAILCGHVHRPVATTIGRARVAAAPSTSFQVELDLIPEQPPRLVMEPPVCLVHVFEEGRFVTHTSYIESAAERIDVGAYFPDWDAVRTHWQARKEALGGGG